MIVKTVDIPNNQYFQFFQEMIIKSYMKQES